MRIQIGNEVVEVNPPSISWKVVVAVIVAIVLIVAAFQSIYTVQVEEKGVVLRFGKHVETVNPGLHFKLPFGIDEVERVPVERRLTQEFGFDGGREEDHAKQWTSAEEMEWEKNMVTGDLNAALVEWVVQYSIDDPVHYLFRVRNAEATLHDASESVMRQVVGDRTVDEVITFGRQEIQADVENRLRELVDLYELGISIDQVQLKNVDPPEPVQASFNEVNRAQQEKEESINIANGQYNRAVPKARGEAEKKISEAEGYATQRVNEAQGDVARFVALFTEYQNAPEVTRRRIYLETMEEVMPGLGKKVIIDEGANQVLPFLPLGSSGKGITGAGAAGAK